MRFGRAVAAAAVGLLGVMSVAAGEARADPYFQGDFQHRPRLSFDGRDGPHRARVIARIRNEEQPWARIYAGLRDLAESGRAVDHRTSGWEDALPGSELHVVKGIARKDRQLVVEVVEKTEELAATSRRAAGRRTPR